MNFTLHFFVNTVFYFSAVLYMLYLEGITISECAVRQILSSVTFDSLVFFTHRSHSHK